MWAFTFTKVVILQMLIIEVSGADIRCPDNTQIDVTFIIDYPNYSGADNWNKAVQFVADVIKQYKIGPNDARFAAVGYALRAVTLYDLRNLTDYSAFDKALKGPGSQSAQPVTDQVFNTITGWNMFSNKETARKSAQSAAVYITNGVSSYWNKTITLLKSFNVKVVTIGVGSSVSVPSFKAHVASPDDVLLTSSFDTLPVLKNKTIERTCFGKSQQTSQQTSTTLPPVQQQSRCSAYISLTSQVYTNKNNSDCFKLCSANRLCYGYAYKVGFSCEIKLMTGAEVNTADDEKDVNPYISCSGKPDGCLAYSSLHNALTTYSNHKNCFNSCVVTPNCLGYVYSKKLKNCGLYTLEKTVIDTNTDRSMSSFVRCTMK